MSRHAGAYINGQWREGAGQALDNLCPSRGETVWSGNAADTAQVHQAVSSAKAAFVQWSRVPMAERAACLQGYAEALQVRKEAIARAISLDMGKPYWEALTEAGAMVGKVALSIKAQKERAGEGQTNTAFGALEMRHRPHGVMAVFGPFNFPGHLPNGHIVPALLAGNTCVFKPSEQAPSVAAIMVEAFEAAGLPTGCVSVVHGARDTGKALLESEIDGVLFTGSAQTGLAFHRHFAGRPEIMLALEMGGNNPLIVDEVEDVDAAADIIFHSAFITSGQRCTCARRLILQDGEKAEAILKAVEARIAAVSIGLWDEEEVFLGPVVSVAAADAAFAFEKDLQKRGGIVRVGLERSDRSAALLRPGLIDMTGVGDRPDTELFGPLLQIIRVSSRDEAIEQSNATRFGLAAGLIGSDRSAWDYYIDRLRAGIVNWNRPTTGASGAAPFGGPGLSGNHRPSAYYAADYCAWPQASQTAGETLGIAIPGYHTER